MVKASVSQSVERAINVLEVFKQHQRPLSRTQLGEALNAPRSSVAALIQALTELDILSYDQRNSTYLPGLRLLRLTDWMETALGLDESLRDAARQLRDKTLETITVTTPVGDQMELVLVEPGVNPISYVVQPDASYSLWQSSVGTAYLATLSDEAIAKLHKGRRRPSTTVIRSLDEVMEVVNTVRRTGYSFLVGAAVPGVGALSMAVPIQSVVRPLVLAVSGPAERIITQEEAYARTLRRTIATVTSAATAR